MATRYDTCPTCQTQSSVSVCDNCKTDIPTGETPAVSGRVWDATLGGFLSVDLCKVCADTPVNLVALITTPAPEPEQPEGGDPEPGSDPTDAGATDLP